MNARARLGRRNIAAQISAIALVAGAFAGLSATTAAADEFDFVNSSPSIYIVNEELTFTPENEGSAAPQTIEVEVEDENSVQDIDYVRVCLYRNVQGGTNNGTSNCAVDANLNPQKTIRLLWSTDTPTSSGSGQFEVDANPDGSPGFYTLSGTESANYVPTSEFMGISFPLKVSEAMMNGRWTISATAVDRSGGNATTTQNAQTDTYFSVDTNRASVDYGSIDMFDVPLYPGPNQTVDGADDPMVTDATSVNRSSGVFQSNVDSSQLTMAVAPMTGSAETPVTMTNAGGAAGSAVNGARAFAMDCRPAEDLTLNVSTWRINTAVDTDTVRLSAGGVTLENNVFAGGIAEGGSSGGYVNSCQLIVSENQLPAQEYSGVVSMGIGAAN
ncbi:MAG: hypothetical protein WC054_11130 [Candidatus Nanopelagicales bacterium]